MGDKLGGGALPLLGGLALPHAHHLFCNSINPRMDLACLVSIDPTSAAGAGAGGGAGGAAAKLSAHQAARARLIAMARARALGGAAAAATAAAGDGAAAGPSNGEPKRGPTVLVSLFRLEVQPARVWQVSVPVQPSLFEALKTPDGKFIQEEESLAVGDVAWSPDGTRLALSLTLTRTKSDAAAGPSSQAAQSRHAHLIQILSVENGSQLSALATSTRPGPGSPRKLQWTSIPTELASLPDPAARANATRLTSPSEPFSIGQIHALPSLPALDVTTLEKVSTAKNSTMPHYMRAQQQLAGIGSAGAAAQQTVDDALPSVQARLTGSGPLARLGMPISHAEAFEQGLIGGRHGKSKSGLVAEPSLSLFGQRSKRKALSLLCAVEGHERRSALNRIETYLDGSASLGFVDLAAPDRAGLESQSAWQTVSLNLSDGLQHAALTLQHADNSTIRLMHLQLPFARKTSHEASSPSFPTLHTPDTIPTRPGHAPLDASFHLARLGSYLRLYLANVLDAASLCSKIWCAESGRRRQRYTLHGLPVPALATGAPESVPSGSGGTAEWVRIFEEAAKQEGADTTADLLVVLVTGRASAAVESLLLNTVTPGMLRGMETSSTDALSHIKNVCGDFILPACDRIRLLLSEIEGCAKWTQKFGTLLGLQDQNGIDPAEQLSALQDLVKNAIDLCKAISHQTERELLALAEFYKWWRFERERQDHLRQHKEDPHLAIVHDVLTVSEVVQRGPINAKLASYLDGGKPPARKRTVGSEAAGMPSQPSGLGIMMETDPDQSAVLGADGRIQAAPAPAPLPHFLQPEADEEPKSRRESTASRPALRQTLDALKTRVLENRKLGTSVSPRYPVPTRQHHAARMQANEIFSGPATDYDVEQMRDPLVGKTLEGTLWALARGLADLVDTALQRTMPSSTQVVADLGIDPAQLGFGSDDVLERPRSALLSQPSGAVPVGGNQRPLEEPDRLFRQRIVQLPVHGERGRTSASKSKSVLIQAFLSKITSKPRKPTDHPHLVLLKQDLGPARSTPPPPSTCEAVRIMLPQHALAADFLSDQTLALLLPGSGRGTLRATARVCAIDVLRVPWAGPFPLAAVRDGAADGPGEGNAGASAPLAMPTVRFEPHASFRLEPDLEPGLAQLGGVSSAAPASVPSTSHHDDVPTHSGRLWALSAERSTAISLMPFPPAVRDAGKHQPGAGSGSIDGNVEDAAVGRLVQYWDVTALL